MFLLNVRRIKCEIKGKKIFQETLMDAKSSCSREEDQKKTN
jgi:hypothetical protein